jgi:polysaccharide biosynthesis protein VpsJ
MAILERLAACDFGGWDPYDALAPTSWRVPFAVSGLEARLLTQSVKKSPVPLEPVLGIAPTRSAYTLGESLAAAARLVACGVVDLRQHAVALVRDLRATRAAGYPGASWSSPFDVVTRFARFPRSVPNIVVTAFVARGLNEATQAGISDCRQDLEGIADFVVQALPRAADDTGIHFGYTPQSADVILNSNMLAAMTLADLSRTVDCDGLVDLAVAAARFTAARQRADGSFPYSARGRADWVDGFHTSFILQGLRSVLDVVDDNLVRQCHARGLMYYCERLLCADGRPRATARRAWPLDAMSASQAIELLRRELSHGAWVQSMLDAVLDCTRRRLLGRNGNVAYQAHRLWTDRRSFPRWSAAPMAAALAGVAASCRSPGDAPVGTEREGGL